MTRRRSTYISSGGYEIHVSEWGEPGKPFLMMWHGLARTGRDFDEIAETLSESYFVACPDTIGRGLASWTRDDGADYNMTVYAETRSLSSTTTGWGTCAGSAPRWVL